LPKRFMIHLIVLTGLCGLAVTPFFRWGNPSGHDFEFHMYSWMEVLAQWRQGIVYPRWAALAHWGYGEARFLFYPPSSWMVGAALGAILPWKIVPGTYCWIVLSGAGAGMYALARQWLRRSDALFAAAFYAVNPYHLLIVYWRSAYAELLGAILMPLSLLCLLKLKQDGFRPILWLSLTLAGAWLANVPAAVMIHYSVAGLAAVMAIQERSARLLFRTALAVLMGAGLASFFLVPAVYEQSWVNIAQLLSPGVMPQDNFLFTMTANADHNRFNLLVSLVASSGIAALVLVAWLARRSENKNDEQDRENRLRIEEDRFNEDRADRLPWTLLACWGAATGFVMFPISNLLWEYLPKFRFVQLPFRWLLCLNAPLAVLLAVATRQSSSTTAVKAWSARAVVCAFLLTVLLTAGHRIQPPWWDQPGDIQEMADAISDRTGYEGTDEYVPVAADPYEVNKGLRQVSDENGSPINVHKMEWGANEKRFDVHTDLPENLTLRLFNYPAWKVTVNGKPTQTQTSEVTGLLIVPVKAGENEVRVRFARMPDCLVGEIISVTSLGVFSVVWIKTRSRRAGRRAA
jgi:hypothetical protein